MAHDRGRAALSLALLGCGLSLVPLVVAPRIVVRGGFDFDRVEDAAHAAAAALVVITATLVQRRPRGWDALALAVAVALTAAITAELVQAQVPGRSAAVSDLVLDAAGVAAGAGIVVGVRCRIDPRALRWGLAALLAVLGIGTAALVH